MQITREGDRTHIKIEHVEGDLTIESGEGEVATQITFEQPGVRISFGLDRENAEQIAAGITRTFIARVK